MKVLLIQPPNGETIGLNSVFLAEPLGLEMVAASLSWNHECTIIDMRLDPDLKSAIERFRPDACGISCCFTSDVGRTIHIASQIKDRLGRCFVFVGGHHASQRPTDFLGSAVDAVVLGDGEEPSKALLRAIEGGECMEALSSILVTSKTRADQGLFERTFPEMDGLPLPARHLVQKYRPRYQMGLEWPIYSVETARGCTHRCRFCSVWELYGGQRRRRPVEAVVADLITIEGEYIFFTDDVFFLNDKHAERLATAIRQAGIRKHYTCQARADEVVRSSEAVRLWKEIGLKRIFVGFESTSDTGLENLNKGYSSRTNDRAIEILDRLGVTFIGQFIVEPRFSVEEFQILLDYVRRKRIAFPSFTILTPLPGTRLYEETREDLLTQDPEMFDLFHSVLPTKLSLNRFYHEFARLYREGYFARCFWFPTYRILRYLLSVEGARRFFATTQKLRKLCRAETYLKAHSIMELDNKTVGSYKQPNEDRR